MVDAILSRNQIDKNLAVERMKNIGAHVTTSEAVIFGLVADSSHPRFKEVQSIIKTKPEMQTSNSTAKL